MSTVFIAFQRTDEVRAIVEAIMQDNPAAQIDEQPGMVKVNADGRLVVKRATVEEKLGRDFDLQEMHVHLITLSGNIDEDDDQFVLAWKH
ncbi:MAG TPA: MmoB/DmpM family protein [Rhodocyclaceae bacterium]|nr:MmoB/DmpM family protein [Rhodocyclaceae bacterium]